MTSRSTRLRCNVMITLLNLLNANVFYGLLFLTAAVFGVGILAPADRSAMLVPSFLGLLAVAVGLLFAWLQVMGAGIRVNTPDE